MASRRLLATAFLAILAVLAGTASAVRAQDVERICDELLVEMSDGVRLHTWVRRVPPDQPRPVMLEVESYARPGNACPDYVPGDLYPQLVTQEQFDRFTIVHVSKRGTGSSEGVYDVVGPDTQRDIREIIAWAREQPWSNGDIVLTGGSGTGFFAHHGIAEPGVKLALIYTSCADMYRCFRRGGVHNGLAEVYLGVTGVGYQDSLDDRQRLGTATNPIPPIQLAGLAHGVAETSLRETFDDWWAQRSSYETLRASPDVPVVLTTDAYDIVTPYEALQQLPNAWLNTGVGHTVTYVDDTVSLQIRQLVDAVVFGEGEVPEDKVTLVTSLGSVETWRASQVLVRTEPSWPLPDTDWTRLHLSATTSGSADSLNDGTLSLDAPTTFAQDVVPMVSSPGVRADYRTVGWLGGANQTTDFRDEERRGLTFTTPTLQQALEVTGPITARIWATSVAEDFDWSLRLTNVHPDGRSEWVSDGYLRATLRRVDPELSLHNAAGVIVDPWHTFDTIEALPVDEPVEYLIDVVPTSAVFQAGHRLRLDVFPVASGLPDASAGAGTVTVLSGPEHPSGILLPIIPHGCDRSTPLVPGPEPLGTCADSLAAAIGSADASPARPEAGHGAADPADSSTSAPLPATGGGLAFVGLGLCAAARRRREPWPRLCRQR